PARHEVDGRTQVINRYARILLASCAAVAAVALGAAAALAATAWTIKPGGAITTSAAKPRVSDTRTASTLTCLSLTVNGTLKKGSGLSGSGAGSISAVSFQRCTSPLGVTFLLTATALPWHLNLASSSGGVVTGSISHMQIQFAGPSCAAVIDGTSATARNGRMKFPHPPPPRPPH